MSGIAEGPWEVIEFSDDAEVVDANGYEVAEFSYLAINRYWLDDHPDEHWANGKPESCIERDAAQVHAHARLLAAAPDLLAAARDALRALNMAAQDSYDDGALTGRLRAAIAKATAEHPPEND